MKNEKKQLNGLIEQNVQQTHYLYLLFPERKMSLLKPVSNTPQP